MSDALAADTDRPWDEISLVRRDQHRATVLEWLTNGPGTPKEISDDTDSEISSVSIALKDLRDASLVTLLVDEATHKGRYYGLTEDGARIADHVAAVHDTASPSSEDSVPDSGLDWDGVAYVKASKYREAIIQYLGEHGHADPSDIYNGYDVNPAHISRALKRLREFGLIELTVPEDTHKGRTHVLTDAGGAVASYLEERDAA